MRRRTIRASISSAVIACFLAAQTACFSEHVDATDLPTECSIPAGAQGAGKAVVTIKNYDFAPDTLRVPANTTITWVNCDSLAGQDAHTSTSDTGVWSSPLFREGQTFSRIFDRAGVFPYHCQPHPSMKGVIIVS